VELVERSVESDSDSEDDCDLLLVGAEFPAGDNSDSDFGWTVKYFICSD
jgi:hypothetical protein